jgi:hypothetical protein
MNQPIQSPGKFSDHASTLLMRKIHILFGFLMLLSFGSCISIDTSGFHSGYKKLQKEQQEKIVFLESQSSIEELKSSNQTMYAITAASLFSSLQKNDTSLVYLWSPHCHSENCISPVAVQNYCAKNHYQLYIIAEYYDFEKLNELFGYDLTVFSINHLHYKTDYCNKYVHRFTDEIRKNNPTKEETYNRFYFFKEGTLAFTRESLF